MKEGEKKWIKLNDAKMKRVRTKFERATTILSNCLSDIQRVPCFNSDDVKVLSDEIDKVNKAWGKLEQSFKAKIRPENWNE